MFNSIKTFCNYTIPVIESIALRGENESYIPERLRNPGICFQVCTLICSAQSAGNINY
jgi:hypothetical protein